MDLLKRQQHSAFGGSCLIIAPGPSINDITDWRWVSEEDDCKFKLLCDFSVVFIRFTSNYDVVIGE